MTTLVYDPTGTLPDNLIVNESHNTTTIPAIFPTEGCFYTAGLEVRGIVHNTIEVVELKYLIDFIYSPRFTSRSASTGRDVFSYILLLDVSKWSRIFLTYQGVGGDQDTVLLAEVNTLSNADKLKLSIWLSLSGDNGAVNEATPLSLSAADNIYVLAAKVNNIVELLQQDSTLTDYLKNQLTGFNTTLVSINTKYTSLLNDIQNTGIFDDVFTTNNILQNTLNDYVKSTTLNSYVANSSLNVNNGVATLDSVGKIPNTQIPTNVLTTNASGVPNGVASLNSNGLIPESQLPATLLRTNAMGVTNGLATLDINGKLNTSQLPTSIIGAVVYQGTWDAGANNPQLASGVGVKGQYYKVSTAGNTTLDGINKWYRGDTLIFNGTTWDKIDGIQDEILQILGTLNQINVTTSNGTTNISLPDKVSVNEFITGKNGDSFCNTEYDGVNPQVSAGNKVVPVAVKYKMYTSGHSTTFDSSVIFSDGNGTANSGTVTFGVSAFNVTGNISTPGNISTTGSGTITSAGDIFAFSDARLKSNITPIIDALSIIQSLQGVNYIKDGKPSVGFIAQDVQKILPELIRVGDDANHILSLAYGNITAVLNEGIKMCDDRITSLEKTLHLQTKYISSLEKKIILLEGKI